MDQAASEHPGAIQRKIELNQVRVKRHPGEQQGESRHWALRQRARIQTKTGKLLHGYTAEQQQALQAAEELAQTCHYEAEHTHQVTYLALRLFDELRKLHHLGMRERYYLECAGILHDIGWIEGWKGHHKAALKIILRTSMLPMENRERLIIGSVARYHTKALPGLRHDHFAALRPADQQVVRVLAALLRLADALDRTHHSHIRDVQCKISGDKIRLRYRAPTRNRKEEKAARKSSDLMEQVFGRKLSIQWRPI